MLSYFCGLKRAALQYGHVYLLASRRRARQPSHTRWEQGRRRGFSSEVQQMTHSSSGLRSERPSWASNRCRVADSGLGVAGLDADG